MLFHSLIGGYVEGDNFVPIRFGVKQNVSGKNYIYVVIDSEKIKTADVTAGTQSNKGRATPTESANINVAKLLAKVNSPDILKYVPDEFLDEERKTVKYSAIADTVRRTNEKNDKKYISFIKSGNIQAATNMVKSAARAAGYTATVYHGSAHSHNSYRRGELGIHLGTKKQAESRLQAKRIKDGVVKKLYANLGNSYEIYRDYGDWHGKNVALFPQKCGKNTQICSRIRTWAVGYNY